MAPTIDYLKWITGRPERAVHDLGSSDLRWGDDPLERGRDAVAGSSVRESVAAVYDVSPDRVLVTAGASHANLLAFVAELDRGERILVERPGYEPLYETPRLLGTRVDRFDRPADDGYPLEPGQVASRLEPDTALTVVTNRHNPSGRRVSRDALRRLAETVADRDSRLLVDEVYAPFGAAPTGDRGFGGPTAAGLDGTVVTGSLTKFHGLGGLRVGWLVADAPFVERARSAAHHVPTLAERSLDLARRAFAGLADLSSQSRSRIGANAGLLQSFVEERSDLSGPVFDGSSFAFLRHGRADGDAVSEAAWVDGVLVVPGRFFDDRDGFRVSLGGDPEQTTAALDAFGAVLDEL